MGTREPLLRPSSPVQDVHDMPSRETPNCREIYKSFVLFSCCFSINHACVTTVLGLASTEFGHHLGGYSSGTLYICYTLCALLGATGIVDFLGQKRALVVGTAAYCVYVTFFLVGVVWPDVKWAAAISGSVIGGTAAGWLWTAQSGYMTSSVEAFTDAMSTSELLLLREANDESFDTATVEETLELRKKTSSQFAGAFSTAYLGFEVGLKLVTYVLLQLSHGRLLTFGMCSAAAVLSAMGMVLIKDVEVLVNSTGVETRKRVFTKTLAAVELLGRDIKMPLMYPMQMAFGFTSSFLTYYVTKDVINTYFSEASIPLLAAVISGVAALLSLPTSWLVNRIGKPPVVGAGICCFIVVTTAFAVLPTDVLGQWKVMVPLYVLYGYARCIFEGQNKAVMTDYFPHDGPGWGANVIVASGGASALGFFLFPAMTKAQMAAVCLVTSCLALGGYAAAEATYRQEQRRAKAERSLAEQVE